MKARCSINPSGRRKNKRIWHLKYIPRFSICDDTLLTFNMEHPIKTRVRNENSMIPIVQSLELNGLFNKYTNSCIQNKFAFGIPEFRRLSYIPVTVARIFLVAVFYLILLYFTIFKYWRHLCSLNTVLVNWNNAKLI